MSTKAEKRKKTPRMALQAADEPRLFWKAGFCFRLCSRNLWIGSLGELLVLETGCSGAEASNYQGAKHARAQTEPDCSGTADIDT